MALYERVEILTTDESDRWNEALEEMCEFDFHHLPSYHRLAEMRGEGRAVMIVYRGGDCLISFPLLLRPIDTPLGAAGYMDATSVHGYAGPLASVADLPQRTARRFTDILNDFFASHNVVTAFTRLHPLFDQSPLLKCQGEIGQIGVTLSMDLTRPPSEQYAQFRRSHRYEIERLRKLGFTCGEVGKEHLDDFARIYTQTMLDLHADEFYLYDRAYFDYLMGEMSGVVHLFICRDGDEVACVGLFATCRGIIQYHLAGTAAGYRKLAPMKLMLDTVRLWGNDLGAKTLHLGGGVGARRDRLYQFKMGFGSREHPYMTWRHVVNPKVYEALREEARKIAGIELDNNYFPAYRHPLLHADKR